MFYSIMWDAEVFCEKCNESANVKCGAKRTSSFKEIIKIELVELPKGWQQLSELGNQYFCQKCKNNTDPSFYSPNFGASWRGR